MMFIYIKMLKHYRYNTTLEYCRDKCKHKYWLSENKSINIRAMPATLPHEIESNTKVHSQTLLIFKTIIQFLGPINFIYAKNNNQPTNWPCRKPSTIFAWILVSNFYTTNSIVTTAFDFIHHAILICVW